MTSVDNKKMAPVIGYKLGIPWSLHCRAWDAYAKKYGGSQSAERLAERGGFGLQELDMFVPEWRDEVSEISGLKNRIENLTKFLKYISEKEGAVDGLFAGDLQFEIKQFLENLS